MTVRMEGMKAHLEGDWTITGAEENSQSLLLFLNQIETGGPKQLSVECGQIFKTDRCGLQLLNVWLLCLRLRGVEPKLVHMTEQLSLAIRQFGLDGLTGPVALRPDTRMPEQGRAREEAEYA